MLRFITTHVGNGVHVSYTDSVNGEVVRFEVERIDLSNTGPVATVTVKSKVVGAHRVPGTDIMFTERLYLFGMRSRGDIAKTLANTMPSPSGAAAIDWDLVMNGLVAELLASQRRPLEVVNLAEVPREPDQRYLIPGVLPVGKATILYGAGGTGKSMFAMGAAAAVQTGTSFAGFTHIEQGNVLYLDWESDQGDLSNRLYMASRGLGLKDSAPVRYLSCDKPMGSITARLASLVDEHRIALVVVDSIGMATAGGRDSGDLAEAAIRFFLDLRALGCSVLAIDHIASEDVKKGAAGTSKPFGSVFKVNAARNTFELQLDPRAPTGEHRLIMRHRKTNMGPRMSDRNYLVDWQPESVRFEESHWVPAVARPMTNRIIDALITGAMPILTLVEVVSADGEGEVTELDVRSALRPLLQDKDVVLDGGNVRLVDE